jgi:alpha-glucosidase (family GH31 glycosyl hydrolase)
MRYSLFHYLYTTFYITTQEGSPIVRPMWQEYPKDVNTFNLDQQFMFGKSLLIAPKLE